jgi:hypothetical protein
MSQCRTLAFAFLAMTAGSAPAWAFAVPDVNAAPPSQHQLDQAATPSQPYAMNYSDEAARKLGVQDGKWEAFITHSSDPLMPSLKGGIDHGGAMISLQWRPGL